MSEKGPSAPTTSPDVTPPTPEVGRNDEAILEDNPNAPIAFSEVPPEDGEAKILLEGLRDSRNKFSEEMIVPAMNRISEEIDTHIGARSDKVIRRVTLIDRRVTAKQKKTDRLERKLGRMQPGTIRYGRLETKIGKKQRQLGEMRETIGRHEGGTQRRAERRETVEKARARNLERKKMLIEVAKAVAREKARRNRVKSERENADSQAQREWLRTEISSWPHIADFKRKLMEEEIKKLNKLYSATESQRSAE